MKTILTAAITAGMILSTSVNAQTVDISWDHIEVSYITSDFEVDGENTYAPNGFAIKGMHELKPSIFTSFGYQSVGGEVEGTVAKTNMDVNTFHIGLGYKSVMNPTMHWYLSGGVLKSEVDTEFDGLTASEDSSGFYLETGLRKQFTYSVDGDLILRNVKYSGSSITEVEANLYHRVGSYFSLGAGVSVSKEVQSYHVLLRYKY
jgi:hypothetical protein